jgi:zinc/manganese transport system substrate-binding protein
VRIASSFFCMMLSPPALAALNIFACTPEWGALARELGGDKVSIYVATTALQDAHRIEARPSLIARARSADLVVCTGAELESGWLPLVISQSGNARIRPGQPGYFEAADFVALIEKPEKLDRSLGDIHAAGNPHIHLDPRNVAEIAAGLAARMAELDSSSAGSFETRSKAFLGRWQESTRKWEQRAAPLKGTPVVVNHRDFAYLLAWLGMREVGSLEPKPGLPPSTASLTALLAKLKETPAKAVLRAAYNDARPSEWLAQRAGMPAVMLPYTVGGSDKAKDLFGLFDDTLERLLAIPR